MRVGFSKDIHELISGKDLILGGVKIPFDKGEKAHSDGDVVLHSLLEAILGALCLGDLGTHFPDTSSDYKDISSLVLAKEVYLMMDSQGYRINNCDIFISLERPKLYPYISKMRENIAKVLHTSINNISIKAGTNEGFGEVGISKAVISYAIVSLKKKD